MIRNILLAAVVFLSASMAQAFEPRTTGVVLMHGKWGSPGDPTTQPLATALQAAGFLVDQPEMPWSGRRLYDAPWDGAVADIDASVARLRARGATKIVVSGQSMGGAGAVAYVAAGRPVDAAVLVAPAHAPDGQIMQARFASAVAGARDLVAAGRGDSPVGIVDLNNGDRTRSMQVKAAMILSYFAPDSPIAMSRDAGKLGTTPVLWVAGTLDVTQKFFAGVVWPRIPAETPKEHVDVVCDHLDTPRVARDIIVNWLKSR